MTQSAALNAMKAEVTAARGGQKVQRRPLTQSDAESGPAVPHFGASLARIPATPEASVVQRKCAACEAGDKEEEQSGVQPRLEVGPVDDHYEREADAIAAQVLLTPTAAPPPANDNTGEVRRCADCEAEDKARPLRLPSADNDGRLRRKCAACEAEKKHFRTVAVPGGATQLAASSQQLTSGGRPLSTVTRGFFETRMGRDLSSVRVHEGAKSQQLNGSIAARAFTYADHIWLGRGERADSGFTMAHELAHVLQQTQPGAVRPGPLPAMEATNAPRVVSRRGVVGRPMLRPPPLRVPPRAAPPGQIPQPSQLVPYHQQYAAPQPYDDSLHAMMWRASQYDARERTIRNGQIPWATTQRGGSPPDFISDAGEEKAMMGDGTTVTYRKKKFHILEAIEHKVAQANSDADIIAILGRYLPDSFLARGVAVEQLLQRKAPVAFPGTLVTPFFREFTLDDRFDPGAELRMQVLSAAVKKRTAAAPQLLRGPIAQAIAANLLLETPNPQAGPCNTQQVPRSGGHTRHNAFADHVTGSSTDCLVQTPEGPQCRFDGLDPHRQLWEVKTGYRYFSEANIVWSPDVPKFHEMIIGLEEQRARCTFVAARCGYAYAYAFDDPEVARFFRNIWGGLPPVLYIPPPK